MRSVFKCLAISPLTSSNWHSASVSRGSRSAMRSSTVPTTEVSIVSVEISTPEARAFVDAVVSTPLGRRVLGLSSRELRAIIDDGDLLALTRPMSQPVANVVQDLWQLTHLRRS